MRNMQALRGRTTGFTLLELMIAVTIVATLAAIALPLYTQYSERAWRQEPQQDMMNCAQGLERFYSTNWTYAGAADTNDDGVPDADNGPIATQICNPTSVDRYTITVVGDATTYTLTATPDAAGPMADDGFMTYNDAQVRAWDKNNSGAIDAGEDNWDEH